MLFYKKSLLVVPAIMLIFACNKANPVPENPQNPTPIDTVECQHTEAALGLVSISGPASITLGQTINLDIVVQGSNGCAVNASVSGSPNTTGIALNAMVTYKGCMCTQALTELNATYSFTPTSGGIYVFQGFDYDGNPIQHTVDVQ